MQLSGINYRKERVSIRLEDCPVQVGADEFALMEVEGSSLVRGKTIVRHDEETGLTEGDVILDKSSKEELGMVVYSGGFYMQDSDGNLKEIPDREHIKVWYGSRALRERVTDNPIRSPLLFSCNGKSFDLRAILMLENGMLVIRGARFHYDKVLVNEVKMMTGIGDLCFGDYYDGGYVVLHKGHPCVQRGEEFIRLKK